MMENQTLSSRLYEMLCLSRLTYAVVKVLLNLIEKAPREAPPLNPASDQPSQP
jgi:hypothetical protein